MVKLDAQFLPHLFAFIVHDRLIMLTIIDRVNELFGPSAFLGGVALLEKNNYVRRQEIRVIFAISHVIWDNKTK